MAWTILTTSVLTGVFCALFSVVVGYVADALSMNALVVLSFFSGFLGSLFAQLVLRRNG